MKIKTTITRDMKEEDLELYINTLNNNFKRTKSKQHVSYKEFKENGRIWYHEDYGSTQVTAVMEIVKE